MSRRCCFIVIALLLGGIALEAGEASALTIQLAPSDDSFVFTGDPDTVFGADEQMASGYAFSGAQQWRAYLKFDLSSLPAGTITAASLHMVQFLGSGFTNLGTRVYRAASDAWNEGSLTWNNQPDGGVLGTLLDQNEDGFAHFGESSWDLLSTDQGAVWDPTDDLTDGFLSLVVTETGAGDQTHNWRSKEYQANPALRPYLLLEVPEPGTVALFGAAFLALAAAVRRPPGQRRS
jgi:hypothetical protein